MGLQVPMLDDRRFQDIVDEAKSLIPHFCPEWTDHNVSDPGVTLIELFAWMTEMLLYRVNQVPDKMYVKFLELIGVRLEPPRAATAPVTFYLSAAQPTDVTIPNGTEVATVRTETSPAIIFTTESDLVIRTPNLLGAFSRGIGADGNAQWITHDLRQLQLPEQRIPLFPSNLRPGDGFYLALERDHSHHVLALIVDCELAGGAGVDPNNPPLEWQAWQGNVARWASCEVEYDGTGGFNQPGEVILHTPSMTPVDLQGTDAFWLRCRLTSAQAGPGGYRVSPDIQDLQIQARGGTSIARHAVTVHNDLLGTSTGVAGQSFELSHKPILSLHQDQDRLVVETTDGQREEWTEVADFADSGPDDRHFALDHLSGRLSLGPSLLQPDGSVYRFGAVPPRGSTLRVGRYQYGGGVVGNVPRNTLTVTKSSIPYVARVTNRMSGVEGRDAQSLEDAKVRAPSMLRTRTRAVTADDYEHLACRLNGVARAHCLAPGSSQDRTNGTGPRAGEVVLLIVPDVGTSTERLTAERLALSAELRSDILADLNTRQPIGISLEVRPPQYVWVSVHAVVRAPEGSDAAVMENLRRDAVNAINRYLNPLEGGPAGGGWQFGRALHISEIYGLLQRLPGVDYVELIQLSLEDPGTPGVMHLDEHQLSIAEGALICSGQHEVRVR